MQKAKKDRSKNVLLPGHNHLLTTGTDDPLLAGALVIIKVLGHQHWWLDPGNRTFSEVASMVVTWWIVFFCMVFVAKYSKAVFLCCSRLPSSFKGPSPSPTRCPTVSHPTSSSSLPKANRATGIPGTNSTGTFHCLRFNKWDICHRVLINYHHVYSHWFQRPTV